MATHDVDISLKGLLEDLDNGMTWLKCDDQGYGSIQEKYNAKPLDIAKLRLNPKLKNAETTITIFNLIDDTDEPNTTSSNEPAIARAASTSNKVQQVPDTSSNRSSDQVLRESTGNNSPVFSSSSNDDDGLSAFADL